MPKEVVLSSLLATFLTLLALHTFAVSSAQVMQSTSYQIQSDSLNVGGDDVSSSSNYGVRSTIGEVGTGVSDSTSYAVGAGYRQMQEIYIALSGSTNITLSPEIGGVAGGTANGSATLTVITDSSSGYVLTISAGANPAMQKGADTIADYNPGDDPSIDFSQAAGEAGLAFTPEGDDIIDRFRDNGATCDTGGSLDTPDACWDGLSITGDTIASKTSPNHPDGSTTTIKFRVNVGSGVNLTPGLYVATTTVTALPL